MSDLGVLFLLRSGAMTPVENMQLDATLLDCGSGLTLRLYRWRPFGLSLGFFQPEPDAPTLAHLEGQRYEVVRRLTGGGAIFHAHELTYSLSGPDGEPPFDGPVDQSYRLVHDVLIRVFHDLGVDARRATTAPTALGHREQPFMCFERTTACDLVADGGKLVGSAKRRRGGRALQHGSIILAPHPALGETAALEELTGAPVDADALGESFAADLATTLGRSLEPITSSEI